MNITVHVPDGVGVSVMRETIRFTQRNWNWRQTVVLSGVEDGNTRDEAPVTITHTVLGGGYDGVKIDPVTVTVRDDDERRVHTTPSALTVQQGQTRRYRIFLEAEPSGPVTVTTKVPAGNGLSAKPKTIRFTRADWDTPKVVTVRLERGERETGKDPHHRTLRPPGAATTASPPAWRSKPRMRN